MLLRLPFQVLGDLLSPVGTQLHAYICMCVFVSSKYFIFIISSYGMHVRRLLINDFSAVVVIRFVVVAFCTRLLLPGGALLLLLLLAAVLCT